MMKQISPEQQKNDQFDQEYSDLYLKVAKEATDGKIANVREAIQLALDDNNDFRAIEILSEYNSNPNYNLSIGDVNSFMKYDGTASQFFHGRQNRVMNNTAQGSTLSHKAFFLKNKLKKENVNIPEDQFGEEKLGNSKDVNYFDYKGIRYHYHINNILNKYNTNFIESWKITSESNIIKDYILFLGGVENNALYEKLMGIKSMGKLQNIKVLKFSELCQELNQS